jgi:predicted RNase H-like nuclease
VLVRPQERHSEFKLWQAGMRPKSWEKIFFSPKRKMGKAKQNPIVVMMPLSSPQKKAMRLN